MFSQFLNHTGSLRRLNLLFFAAIALPTALRAQVPSLLWTNSGGRVFSVDEQTNVYARSNGTVVKLSANGSLLDTVVLCPLPGVAQRDSAGAYYFSGVQAGTGPTGNQFPSPAFFVAKYTSAGSLIWSNNFGPTGTLDATIVGDLQLDSQGNAYAAYSFVNHSLSPPELVASKVAKFDATGSNIWVNTLSSSSTPYMHFGLISPTNSYVVTYTAPGGIPGDGEFYRFDSNGTPSGVTSWATPAGATASLVPSLVIYPSGEFYASERSPDFGHPTRLMKRTTAGSVLWQINNVPWPVGRDLYGGVHTADSVSQLSRRDSDGTLVWSMTLPTACLELFLDPSGNRFVSLTNGTVGRLSGEILSAPAITNPPTDVTVLVGSNAVFSVGVTGSTPLRYFWIFNGATVGTNATLNLNNVSTPQAGPYFVIVSNTINSVTSAPAMLRVKRVAIYAGNQLLTGTYVFATPPTLSVRSTFPSGSSFYTLDGSPPSFSSTPYTAPFVLSQSATVRAVGYSSDFLQSDEADAVNAIVLAQHTLTASSPGGGSITLNPPGGTYSETNIVAASAVTSPGWTFLYWQGDASGTNPSVNVLTDRNKTIQAIFGTSLSTTVAGNGQVVVQPVRTLYPYGEVVRLTGVPQPGNYFGFWGNAATGNTNPLNFTMVGSNPVVSSIFAAVPSGQAAFTLMINGRGQVTVNPRANVYSTNQSITLTAIPDAGRSFAGWTSDASGTVNPLIVLMNQDKLITANFHSAPTLSANRAGFEGMSAAGFRFSVIGDFPYNYQILASSNLISWEGLAVVTNDLGDVQFLDSSATNRPVRFYRAAPMP